MIGRQKWPPPPQDPILHPNEAHAWLTSLEATAERLAGARSVLNREELHRADRFLQPQHRAHHALGRAILRELLGGYLDISPQAVELQFNEYGKPCLGANHRS